MERIETGIKDCFIIKPNVHGDARGYFFESYSKRSFQEISGLDIEFIQDNQALSGYGTLRGLHFQKGDAAQAKLVRVMQGRVVDVAVDLRKDSDTFGLHVAVELSAENNLQLFVPRGFAHGYSVLEPDTIFVYKCDNLYNKSAEGGLIYNDPQLKIDWRLPTKDMLLSEKDTLWPTMKNLGNIG
ncbi:MAG: dTDP-4-dehydrorhamnose 3,5-epimerase [Bacteroidetes bacterium]|jgi:dTDP-4-dehydrorhamnose 3,5-epimerase|nr:dTDP-4-dehydrorhamnose 3,5-epimerase [Bacteroidota bacterium]